jgi:hypothetical protein
VLYSKNEEKDLVSFVFFLFFLFFLVIILKLIYQINSLKKSNLTHADELQKIKKDLQVMKSRDEYKINQNLTQELKNIETTYDQAVKTYESLLDLKTLTKKTEKLDIQFVQILTWLSQRNFSSAEAGLKLLSDQIRQDRQKIVSSFQLPKNAVESNNPPGAGFSQQIVKTEIGNFLVDIVAADLNSTRVIVDTASDSDCHNDCPVLPLAEYINRSGAFAGINGSYFCPAEYPSCSDKKNLLILF